MFVLFIVALWNRRKSCAACLSTPAANSRWLPSGRSTSLAFIVHWVTPLSPDFRGLHFRKVEIFGVVLSTALFEFFRGERCNRSAHANSIRPALHVREILSFLPLYNEEV